MSKFFLGKPWHWGLIVVVSALLWWAGESKLHVRHFNAFIAAILMGGTMLVLLVVHTTRSHQRVTREPLLDPLLQEEHDTQ